MSLEEEMSLPQNVYTDYPIMQSRPWAYTLRKQQCVMFREHRLNLLFSPTIARDDINNSDFDEISDDAVMKTFFPNGKFNCVRLGHNVDKFIFWAVTRGCYKSDKNKRVWVWTGTKTDMRHITDPRTRNLWQSMSDGFGVIQEITEECNRVLELLKENLQTKMRGVY